MRTITRKDWWLAVLALSVFIPAGVLAIYAQEGCRPPMPAVIEKANNIFNEQQEMDLGDAMAEHLQRNYRVSSHEQWIGYLRQIAERLLQHLPVTRLRLQLFLVDLPNANAFDSPGGRVYISLKLVAMARNEDELAGVLAHEFGHMVVHQGAVDMSRDFKLALNVKEVSDRRDIFEKYHQLIEVAWRKQGTLVQAQQEGEEAQEIADRLALYAITGAGYSTEAFADVFDRIAGTEGKTGNRLTDFFGATRPDSKRFREMIKARVAIPEGCTESAPKAGADQFKTWQAAVIANPDWSDQEILHGVLSKTKLNPPLRGEITHLKYSPNGMYILAQDEGNIYVLNRQPFVSFLRIDAPDAAAAQFTPDSQSVIFQNHELRVETWNIATRMRTSVHELVVQKGCWQTDLSPDGKELACLEGGHDLVLLDVATGEELFRKAHFNPDEMFGDLVTSQLMEQLGFAFYFTPKIYQQFSPDSHYFLAMSGDATILVDLANHEPLSVPGALKKHLTGRFTFLGTQKLVATNGDNPAKSHVLSFPSGEILSDVTLGKNSLATATRGDYLMLRPVEEYGVGVMDLDGGKHLFANKQAAMDIYDHEFVCEERNGELGLFDIQNYQRRIEEAALPGGDLGALKAYEISPDWKWLAASQEGRCAIWNLENGSRLYHVRGFRGAYFADDGSFYGDFPKYKDKDREMARLALAAPGISDDFKIKEEHVQQFGQFLLVARPEGKSGGGELKEKVTWEFEDARTGSKLWSRYFPKTAPSMGIDAEDDTILLGWDASSGVAKDEIKNFPAAREVLSSRKEKENSFLVEVVDARTGKALGAVGVETGSRLLNLKNARASGDWMTISDPNNRVLLYSLSTAKEAGRFFGNRSSLSSTGGLLCIENESGHLTLYDINSGQDLDRWVFSKPIMFREFSSDGKRLFVLTADQTAYVLDVSSFARQSVANAVGASNQANSN